MLKTKVKFSGKRLILMLCIMLGALIFCMPNTAEAAKNKTKTEKQPIKPEKIKSGLSEAERLEAEKAAAIKDVNKFKKEIKKVEKKGGKVEVTKGTYYIDTTIGIPSNVTLVLNEGVVIKKIDTGKKKSVFQFANQSWLDKKPTKLIGGYNGVKKAKIIGKGSGSKKARIDLNYVKGSFAIIMAHSNNITVENIDFVNMYSNHFIELNSSSNVTINKCTFQNAKLDDDNGSNQYVHKEAINIDTPDTTNKSINEKWIAMDKTPVKNITIKGCTFRNLGVGIGTHTYSVKSGKEKKKSSDMVHQGIRIEKCTFDNVLKSGVTMLNWKNTVIKNCTFRNGGEFKKNNVVDYSKAFEARGISGGFEFTNNKCDNVGYIGYAVNVNKNSGYCKYDKDGLKNKISLKTIQNLVSKKSNKNIITNPIGVQYAYEFKEFIPTSINKKFLDYFCTFNSRTKCYSLSLTAEALVEYQNPPKIQTK